MSSLDKLERFYRHIFMVGLAGILVVFSWAGVASVQNDKVLVYLGALGVALLCVISMGVLLYRSNCYIVDIRLLFIFSFMIYNCYTPLMFCFFRSTLLEIISGEGSKWVFEKGYIYRAQIASMLYAGGFLVALLFPRRKREICRGGGQESGGGIFSAKGLEKTNFYMWFGITLIGFIWYVYPYFVMGFEQAVSLVRWERYIEFRAIKDEMGIAGKLMMLLFNKYVLLAGVLAMFRNLAMKKNMAVERILWFFLVFAISFFLLFVDGRRREVMIICIMISGYYIYKLYDRGMYDRIRRKVIQLCIIVVFMGIFFIQYQYLRLYVENVGYKQGVEQILVGDMVHREKSEQTYYQNEFGLVYVTNMASIRWRPSPLYGATYVESLVYPVPVLSKSLVQWFGYDQKKTTIVERWLGEIYFEWFDQGGGLGFSPSSEAYINFGYPGCFLIGLALALIMGSVQKRLFSNRGIFFYSMLLGEAYGFSRASSTDFVYEVAWMGLYFVLYGLAFHVFKTVVSKGSIEVGGLDMMDSDVRVEYKD